jgi:glutaredoxin
MENKKLVKKCPYCKRELVSLSKKQLEFNYLLHVGACKNNQKLKGGKK